MKFSLTLLSNHMVTMVNIMFLCMYTSHSLSLFSAGGWGL